METHADGEYTLPRTEAMLAGTLALMTGYAQNLCPNRRMLLALKIRHNLEEMRQQANWSQPFCAVLRRLCHEWGALAVSMPALDCAGDRAGLTPTPEEHSWLPGPGQIQ